MKSLYQVSLIRSPSYMRNPAAVDGGTLRENAPGRAGKHLVAVLHQPYLRSRLKYYTEPLATGSYAGR